MTTAFEVIIKCSFFVAIVLCGRLPELVRRSGSLDAAALLSPMLFFRAEAACSYGAFRSAETDLAIDSMLHAPCSMQWNVRDIVGQTFILCFVLLLQCLTFLGVSSSSPPPVVLTETMGASLDGLA